MHDWKYPDSKTKSIDFVDVTDEILLEWKKIYEECNEHNNAIKERLFLLRKEMIGTAIGVWGENSNVVRYLKRQRIYSPSTYVFDDLRRQIVDAKKRKEIEIREIQNREAKTRLTEKAINWLTQRGKLLGVDFMIGGALSLANGIALEEEVSKRIEEIQRTGVNIEFSGGESCEDCDGWDGTDNRCQCGTRRVGWSSNDNDDFFLEPHIFGEAH